MITLDQEKVKKSAGTCKHWIQTMQVVVYTMAGGGQLGALASEQPADFYIDARVGKLPYKRKEIYQAVKTLATIAEANGLDPCRLDPIPPFHNMGIF